MEKIRIAVLMTAAVALVVGLAFSPEKALNEEEHLREIAPDIVFSPKQGNPPHFPSVEGVVAFNSHDAVPSIRGYAGPIKILIALRGDGMITGLKLLEHTETKNYVHYMESTSYLRKFLGKSIYDPFEINRDIDGISRATVSVKALARTVKESSRKIAIDVFGLDVDSEGNTGPGGKGWVLFAALFLSAFMFYSLSRKHRGVLVMRDLCLALGIVITGMYLSSPFSILHVLNLAMFNISSSILWYLIVGSVLISFIVAGRFYCGWLCPFGALSEFIGRIPLRKWKIPVEIDDKGRLLKYALLALAVLVVFITRRADFANYEVYVTLFSLNGHMLAWVLLGVMLAANLRNKRFWCRYVCPVAAFSGLFARKDRGYASWEGCPMGNKPDPGQSECIRCNQCYSPKRKAG